MILTGKMLRSHFGLLIKRLKGQVFEENCERSEGIIDTESI